MSATDDALATPDLGLAMAVDRLALVFREAGLDETGVDARILVLAASGFGRTDLLRTPERPLGQAAARLNGYVERRIAREPVSRILGRREFWSLDLEITPDVLDPRPDTETLVEAALAQLGDRRCETLRFLDLGTGSGALVCALLSECPDATALGLDVSAAACRVAQRNIDCCGFGLRGSVQAGGWRDARDAAFDLIVSNPPYIPTEEIGALAPEVSRYDPFLALDGGADGLAAYRDIAAALPPLLRPRGAAVLEIGAGQSGAVIEILRDCGLSILTVRRDLAGLERAIVCEAR